MNILKRLLVITFLALLGVSCGGNGDDNGSSPGDTNTPPAKVTITGKAVFNPNGGSTKPVAGLYKSSTNTLYDLLDQCAGEYQTLWSDLTPNLDTATGMLNRTRTIMINSSTEEFIATDIDSNVDNEADLNIEVSNIPDFEYVEFLNFDADCDGVADINIDTNGNGVPNLNIDQNADGVGDFDAVSGSASTVPNASVRVVEPPEERYSSTTDSNGEFEINEIAPGEYGLEISKTGVSSEKLSKIANKNQSLTVWTRAKIYANEDTDLGTFALDSGPYIDKIVNGGENRPIRYGSRRAGDTMELELYDGQSTTWEIYFIDPNSLNVNIQYHTYTEEAGYHGVLISTSPIAGQSKIRKATVKITVHSNHYTVNFNNGEFIENRIPSMVGGVSMRDARPDCDGLVYDACDLSEPLIFNWDNVEQIGISVIALNTDGISVLNGRNDIESGVQIHNTGYTYQEITDVPDLNAAAINGTFYENPDPSKDFVVDLGDITDETTISIGIDSAADEGYQQEYYWDYPHTLTTEPEGESFVFNVNELPKTYPSSWESRVDFVTQYEGSAERVRLTVNFDVAGNKEPASCDDLLINGSSNTEGTLYYVGQQLSLQAVTSDPKGLPVEFAVQRIGVDIPYSESFITGYNENDGSMVFVPASEIVSYTLALEDNSDIFGIRVFCRNNDGFGMGGAQYPDDFHTEMISVSQ